MNRNGREKKKKKEGKTQRITGSNRKGIEKTSRNH
jgi:hypothetical protein